MSSNSKTNKNSLHRVNTRVYIHQDEFVKAEVKKSKGELKEGEVYRQLLQEAIDNRKNK